MGKIGDYAELFKLRQTFLLTYSGVFGYLIASGLDINWNILGLFVLASVLSISGTTGINMYFDWDIDALMSRTANRPLPKGRISRKEALFVSSILTVAGILVGFLINFWVGLAVFLGFFIDIAVYTVALKRRSPISVALGAIAGGMPIFGGYMSYTGAPDLKAVCLLSIIALWAIAHIWFIAIYFLEDYRRARVPMLPVVVGAKKALIANVFVVLGIDFVVVIMYLEGLTSIYSLVLSFLFTGAIIYLALRCLFSGDRSYARKAYKVLNPYQGVLLLALWLEKIFGLV